VPLHGPNAQQLQLSTIRLDAALAGHLAVWKQFKTDFAFTPLAAAVWFLCPSKMKCAVDQTMVVKEEMLEMLGNTFKTLDLSLVIAVLTQCQHVPLHKSHAWTL
jgi:hypothetical protein